MSPSIRIVEADITTLDVDVVVNAANSSLLGGGGVDGAIHRKGGPDILAECRKLRAGHYGRGLKTGQAVATTAGKLPAKWVVHTVGPVWSASEDRSGLLADCHRNSLKVAGDLKARTVAFPAISTGIYGYPLAEATAVAVAAVRNWKGDGVDVVRFVCFDEATLAAYEAVL